MRSRAHAVDRPPTAFVEVWGELCPHTAFALENQIANRPASVLNAPYLPCRPGILPQASQFRSRHDTRKNIQSP
jgi:hypothetical protein